MAYHVYGFCILLSLGFLTQGLSSESLARGWGEQIKWRAYKEGLKEAKTSNKPIMLLIHKTWCGACKALKPSFAASKDIITLSKYFVMINVEDEEEPKNEEYKIDGRYIPRIFFLGPEGGVMKHIYNKDGRHKETKFYYGKTSEIADSMRLVIKESVKDFDEADLEPAEEENKSTERQKSELARGFGDYINWKTYEDGLRDAKEDDKMMVLIIHKTWCGSCKALKPKLASHKEFEEMSENFVMVNTEDDEEPKGSQFIIDGEYVPRILFLDSNGKVDKSIWNEGTKHPHVKYYYANGQEIVNAMKRALVKKQTGKLPQANTEEAKEAKQEDKESKDPWWKRSEEAKEGKGRGFGDHIKWMTYSEAVKESKTSNKMMMLIIHKTWCTSCKALKPKLADHKEFGELSKQFVMVNVEDDEEPKGDQFKVDGSYVPRIFFIDPKGEVQNDLWNENTKYPHVKYYYHAADELVDVMKKALKTTELPVSDNGFGSHIQWMTFDSGLKEAKEKKKPVMLVLHKSWCQLSQAMKPKFAESKEIGDLSKTFVMINLEDDQIPNDSKYAPDGSYVPRILFLDSTGDVNKEIINEDSDLKDSKFYYHKAEEIVKAMKKAVHEETNLDRGFGKDINWMTYEQGLKEAKTSKKPMMLIIHKSWCGACKALKPDISESKRIQKLSKEFIMVNVEDDEEPHDPQFDVDGKYYPRIFFLDSEGKVQNDLHNTDLQYLKFKYTYADPDLLEEAMEKAIEKLKPQSSLDRVAEDAMEKETEEVKPKSNLDRGLGKNIDWKTLEEGQKIAAESWKPLMLIIHKSWCSACKTFKPKFAESQKIVDMSKNLVMVNVEDEFDPTDEKKYELDGAYVPRIIFIGPTGQIMKDISNSGTIYKENKYYYWEPNSVIKSMEKAVDRVKVMSKPQKKDEL